jgi:hypothetical protein
MGKKRGVTEEAREIYSRLDVRWGIIGANTHLAILDYYQWVKLKETKQRMLECYDLCQQFGIRWISAGTYDLLAVACFLLGELSEAQPYTQQMFDLVSGMGLIVSSRCMLCVNRFIGKNQCQ